MLPLRYVWQSAVAEMLRVPLRDTLTRLLNADALSPHVLESTLENNTVKPINGGDVSVVLPDSCTSDDPPATKKSSFTFAFHKPVRAQHHSKVTSKPSASAYPQKKKGRASADDNDDVTLVRNKPFGLSVFPGFSRASDHVGQKSTKRKRDAENDYLPVVSLKTQLSDEYVATSALKVSPEMYGLSKNRFLGGRKGVSSGDESFKPPVPNAESSNSSSAKAKPDSKIPRDLLADPRLEGIDHRMIELVLFEVLDSGPKITWDDIAGLHAVKETIKEIIVWPMLRPDLFVGLRSPPKGLLMFGPPGTGKTLIGRCIAAQSKSTFFNISAASLMSKWVGEGERMVRTLFAVARCRQPAVIFIDEVDSLLSQRSDTEHESSRRLKTEFLVQIDGAATKSEERLLVVGATNRPHEIDEAARRRFQKRLFVPLPDKSARRLIVERLLAGQTTSVKSDELDELALLMEGYSGADVSNVCRDAALGPFRGISDIEGLKEEDVRPISFEDFKIALSRNKATVASEEIQSYLDWDLKFGCGR